MWEEMGAWEMGEGGGKERMLDRDGVVHCKHRSIMGTVPMIEHVQMRIHVHVN